jgi:hypothetical protein
MILGIFDASPTEAGIAIFDGTTPRQNELMNTQYSYASLQWTGNDSTLYAVDDEFPEGLLVFGGRFWGDGQLILSR